LSPENSVSVSSRAPLQYGPHPS